MAKVTLGSIIKGKKDEATGKAKPDYIKIRGDHFLKDGDIINLESKAQALESLEKAVAGGKLSADMASDIRAKVEKTPDWVRFNMIKYTDKKN